MTICEVHGNSMWWLLSASYKTQVNFFDAQLARSANHWHFTLTVWIFWRKSVHTAKPARNGNQRWLTTNWIKIIKYKLKHQLWQPALPLPSSFKPVLVREFHLPANLAALKDWLCSSCRNADSVEQWFCFRANSKNIWLDDTGLLVDTWQYIAILWRDAQGLIC